ncbi:proline/glycine betaine ABC transporter permease [Desulfuromonas acetoxidans]|uniref:Binding-protein-dependent transport systems inner membrane component n=1 Tax=Desulfuromonas acetoxidans (strain DSM 684 / 11070) TaxID=281689 RepID=Q1K385_DESA6|nr:proline/glycine betaine ABC transporter permease [Desulfuromonas acetoxidans]EAT17089.1 binding-protein-dependent transport systems inner membrane component [Desulfuromonas acetoxidans DSM 684]MBF0645687.1 proline/glycine betaine ABC transporter permease [Desulfuromonas acetoxidans]NVD24096.1 proline/glycine betaine ABC transporter permease [Desulfuromonas acetoxidans]NVE16392.1 proline/glycine betaine ABC transporter permease [Desulfuromonas acetoxidans]
MEWLNFEDQLIPLDEWVQDGVRWLAMNYRDIFQAIKVPIEKSLDGFQWLFNSLPPIVVIVFLALLAWRYAGKRVTLFTVSSLFLIGFLGQWEATMTTLSMVVCSVLFCGLVGIPLGILSGRSDRFEMLLRPCLDAMQTTPAFVYLVPVVMLFSIGPVSGILATIVFAMPPIIRLTNLGIRQVHPELVEAAIAFGSTPWQVLCKVQFPLALPSIMAGLNQTIMMALSMVVIAAMIGAGGLGDPVVQGLNTLEIGLATIGGLSIVLLAMILDRITQGIGRK